MAKAHRRRSNKKVLGAQARLERQELGDRPWLSIAERTRRLEAQRAYEMHDPPLRRSNRLG